jgi:hypothetical protein
MLSPGPFWFCDIFYVFNGKFAFQRSLSKTVEHVPGFWSLAAIYYQAVVFVVKVERFSDIAGKSCHKIHSVDTVRFCEASVDYPAGVGTHLNWHVSSVARKVAKKGQVVLAFAVKEG